MPKKVVKDEEVNNPARNNHDLTGYLPIEIVRSAIVARGRVGGHAMKVRLKSMIQDPDISTVDVGRMVEGWDGIDEDHYLDGPMTPRVAVVDLDPNTEQLVPGAVSSRRRPGTEARPSTSSTRTTSSRCRSSRSACSRPSTGRCTCSSSPTRSAARSAGASSPQLLVVPRAGWLANAYYERASHSLQFFSFVVDDRTIHTSLSRDIVAHETAHALIDGIDPDLYDASIRSRWRSTRGSRISRRC